jgi:outer membrane protein assembly factor BamA
MAKSVKKHIGNSWMVLCMLLLLSACNTTRYLPQDKYLLWNNKVELKSPEKIKDRGIMTDQITSVITHRPNQKILGVFPNKLWLYNVRRKKYENDPENFQLKSKTVEAPVILDSVQIEKSRENIRRLLFNLGYFYAKVSDTVVFNEKKAEVRYRINTGINYAIDTVRYYAADSTLLALMIQHKDQTVLQKGTHYTMALATAERSRLTHLIRNEGYFAFNDQYISVELDTLDKSYLTNVGNPFQLAMNSMGVKEHKGKRSLDVDVLLRDPDTINHQKYVINDIRVYALGLTQSEIERGDTAMMMFPYEDKHFYYRGRFIKPKVLNDNILFHTNTYYSEFSEITTFNRMNALGAFQNVRSFFRPMPDSIGLTQQKLNYILVLTPATKRFVNTTFDFVNSSNGTGFNIGLSYQNRNLWKGANLFTISPKLGYEWFKYEDSKTGTAREFGINFSLSFPKFMVPFKVSTNRFEIPKTSISLGYNFISRTNYFNLSNISSTFGYTWKETQYKMWVVNPVFFNVFKKSNVSESFQERLNANPYLAKSYQDIFIEGENIAYIFNNLGRSKRGYGYFRIGLEEAGGLMSAVDWATRSVTKDRRSITDALGVADISQYVKVDADFRYYFTRHKSTYANRLSIGVGVPYGSSQVLPYVKQYFVGGAYSLRGWRLRTLGPGSYKDTSQTNANNNGLFVDQTGDIKIEFSTEYRFDMFKLFAGFLDMKGAVFLDGGNIWSINKNDPRPGAVFEFSEKLWHDVALSTGVGIRALISFIVIRGDFGMPIKNPQMMTNDGWVLKNINFSDPTWRKNNIVFQLAIDYPF